MASINLQKIVSVKGMPGLYHLTNYNPKGYFLQAFAGGPIRFVSNEKGKVLAVGNVDLKLKDGSLNSQTIFLKLAKDAKLTANASIHEIEHLFRELFLELDPSVAPSHMEKMFRWYQLIAEHYQMNDLINEEDDGLTII